MTKIIKNWPDLVGLESANYELKIDLDMGCGHIVQKDESSDLPSYYLSTHTFYGRSYLDYEQLLRKCGFDVKLITWDKVN